MKRTRKSLFISTILMVVLLIVAISTATFAWYSAQDTATAQNASLTTASTSAANIALTIDGSSWVSTVNLNSATGIRPMTPETLPEANSEVEVENANLAFWEGTLKLEGSSSVFSDNPAPVTATSWKAPTEFAVKNQDTSTARYVPITIDVENVNISENGEPLGEDDPRIEGMQKMLRIAIFASNALDAATGNEKLLFLGVYANGGTAYKGKPVPGEGEKDWTNNGLTEITDPVTEFSFNLKGTTISKLTTYAWLDGTMLDAQYQNLQITFNLKFSAGGQLDVPEAQDVPEA